MGWGQDRIRTSLHGVTRTWRGVKERARTVSFTRQDTSTTATTQYSSHGSASSLNSKRNTPSLYPAPHHHNSPEGLDLESLHASGILSPVPIRGIDAPDKVSYTASPSPQKRFVSRWTPKSFTRVGSGREAGPHIGDTVSHSKAKGRQKRKGWRKRDLFDDLVDASHFSRTELIAMHKNFNRISLGFDTVNETMFVNAACQGFSCPFVCRRLYQIFRVHATSRGVTDGVDFPAYVSGVSAISVNASMEERMYIAFKIFDIGNRNIIVPEDLSRCIREVLLYHHPAALSSSGPIDVVVRQTLAQYGADSRGLTFPKFKLVIRSTPEMFHALFADTWLLDLPGSRQGSLLTRLKPSFLLYLSLFMSRERPNESTPPPVSPDPHLQQQYDELLQDIVTPQSHPQHHDPADATENELSHRTVGGFAKPAPRKPSTPMIMLEEAEEWEKGHVTHHRPEGEPTPDGHGEWEPDIDSTMTGKPIVIPIHFLEAPVEPPRARGPRGTPPKKMSQFELWRQSWRYSQRSDETARSTSDSERSRALYAHSWVFDRVPDSLAVPHKLGMGKMSKSEAAMSFLRSGKLNKSDASIRNLKSSKSETGVGLRRQKSGDPAARRRQSVDAAVTRNQRADGLGDPGRPPRHDEARKKKRRPLSSSFSRGGSSNEPSLAVPHVHFPDQQGQDFSPLVVQLPVRPKSVSHSSK